MQWPTAFLIFIICVHLQVVFMDTSEIHLRVGKCRNISNYDLVFNKQITRTRIPFTVRKVTVEWTGARTITCILVKNTEPASEESTVKVISGGYQQNDVKLEMRSARGRPINYSVKIYAKLLTSVVKTTHDKLD